MIKRNRINQLWTQRIVILGISLCALLSFNVSYSNEKAPQFSIEKTRDILTSIAQVKSKIGSGSQDSVITQLDSLTLVLLNQPDSLIVLFGFEIGQAYRQLHRHETAANIYISLSNISQNRGDSVNLTRSLYYLGQSYKNLGLLNKGLESLYQGLNVSNLIGDVQRSCLTQSLIGTILKDKGMFDESISFFIEALELSQKLNDDGIVGALYNNLGSAYKQKGDYGQAKEYFLKAIEINKRINNEKNLSYNYNNLANIHEETGDLDNAINYQLKSIELKYKLDDFPTLSISYSNMTLIYIKKGDYKTAEAYAIKALALAKKYQVASILPIIYSQYAVILSQKGEYKRAFEVMHELNHYKDSIAMKDKEIVLNEMETKYRQQTVLNENALLQKDVALSKADRYQKNAFLIVLVICSGLLLLAVVLYYFLYQSRLAARQLIQQQQLTISVQQERLHNLEAKLTELSTNLEYIKKDKEAFFSSMSHDMRGPISAIMSIVSSLKTESEVIANDEIQMLDYSSRKLLGLVEDALDFSNIEASRLQIEHRSFSLSQLIHNTASSFDFLANEKEIDLILQIDPLPDRLLGDPKRIGQILFNLLGNAFKFTKEGYVKLSASSHLLDDGRENITISIEDSGRGIPQTKLDVIFNKFEQASAKSFEDFGGNGLGLYIVKALTNQMGGTIEVTSKMGEGTTFVIQFNLAIATIV